MDVAKTLIRSVARAFYETKHVIVIDALLIHSALLVDDLAALMGMSAKDLRKLTGKLKEDRMLAVHSRAEIKEGMQRPIQKDYYFIDFHATIDAIKYRVYKLTKRVEDIYKPAQEKKDFYCPKCKAQWTQLEVLDKAVPLGFECHRCGNLLEREEQKEGDAGSETQRRLQTQLGRILDWLKDIDAQDIPSNDFDKALSFAIPLQKGEGLNPFRPYEPSKDSKSAAAKGLKPAIIPLAVSVTEQSAADKAEEAQRKASAAAQNVLPVWHTTSTVTGESTVVKPASGEAQPNGTPLIKEDEDEKKDPGALNDELTEYYRMLAEEKENEAKKELAEEASSGDEFEDVDVGASNAGTPMSGTPADSEGPRSQVNRNGDSGSSGPATNASTPLNGEGPASKKVKFEDATNGHANGEVDTSNAADKVSDEDDEDDEVEFEDV